ncbi:hypothetical protein WAI453_007979 [Rhynchosporium graminicola]
MTLHLFISLVVHPMVLESSKNLLTPLALKRYAAPFPDFPLTGTGPSTSFSKRSLSLITEDLDLRITINNLAHASHFSITKQLFPPCHFRLLRPNTNVSRLGLATTTSDLEMKSEIFHE